MKGPTAALTLSALTWFVITTLIGTAGAASLNACSPEDNKEGIKSEPQSGASIITGDKLINVKAALQLESPQHWPDSTLLPFVSAHLSKDKNAFTQAACKLIRAGADTAFVFKLINHPAVKHDTKYMKINVTGYLGKPDYSSHYNAYSVKKAVAFHEEYDSLLTLVEKKYGVSSEALTAVAWVETRHGAYLGDHNVPSVYLCLSMTDNPEYIELNMEALHEKFDGDSTELIELEQKILDRSASKSAWAVEQLMALQTVETMGHLSVSDLVGSWAGAFGISQFIPSSYVSWAVDGNNDGTINLYDMPDALFSIGNYLKEHGWDQTNEGERKAVWGYNHSTAYVDAVLLLRDKIRSRVKSSAGQAE